MPKIVIFMDSPPMPTGYASTCRLTARHLSKLGWDIYAVALNCGEQPPGIQEWYNIKVIPNSAFARNPNTGGYGDAELVKKIFSDLNPDIFMFHNDSYRYSYLKDVPQMIMDRSVFWLPFEADVPDIHGVELFSRCAATRFVTNHALEIHRTFMSGKDIGIIPHAVDFEAYYPPPDKQPYKAMGGMDGKFVVSRVDRHQPRKLWDLSLEAFAKFAKGKDDVFFAAKCHPRDMTMFDNATKKGLDLEELAAKLGIADKIRFSDYFFNESSLARAYYWPADVFLTTTSGEGFGLTTVEAMACGVPVICPDVPVFPEVAKDGAIRCRVKNKQWHDALNIFHNIVDTDEVASKLEWAYQEWKNKRNGLVDLGAKARAVAERYKPEAVYAEWDKVLRKVMEKRDLVSIVTVLYNVSGDEQLSGADGISSFKETIEQHVKYPYEWIIVDNGSPEREKTRSWLENARRSNPRIRPLFLESNLGFAGGCNAGIAAAEGAGVILANPDSEALSPQKHGMSSDFVKMMSAHAGTDPKIGIVGMELNKRDDVLQGCVFPYFGCVYITRACLEACQLEGGKWLDENFWPAYYEDADFTMRAMGKGFKVEELNIPFYHKSGGTNKFAIDGGAQGKCAKLLRQDLENLAASRPTMADWTRKRGELETGGMQGLISGNIAYLNSKYGRSARQKVKIVWNTRIGDGVGFSQIVEGLAPVLHDMGFDVYVHDWANGSNIEDPVIRQLVSKTRQAAEQGEELESAINIVCWLMENFLDVDSDYKVGISLCESTKVRSSYLHLCNRMDRILTFSEFCRKVQIDSGYTVPIDVITPGVHPVYQSYYERPVKDPEKQKFTFLCVGVSQERKDTRRLVEAFCEAFPKGAETMPGTEPGIPWKPGQVELVLKSNNFGELDWVHAGGYSQRANVRTIFTGPFSKERQSGWKPDFTMQQMRDLYCEADCLVHPSHGEGIGMPILEGAATGLPVIFTNWSSPAEYLGEANSYPLSLGPNNTAFSPAYPGSGPPGENGVWANCHIGHLKHQMFHVLRNPSEARAKGKTAAAIVSSKYNWKESARRLLPLIFEWEKERKGKVSTSTFDPLTFNAPPLAPVAKGDRVCVDIVSRDRHSYVATLLLSLREQTFQDWDVIIQCDDADESMPNDHHLMSLIRLLENEGHSIRITKSFRQGPQAGHQRTLFMATHNPSPRLAFKLICRIDDDIFLENEYLEKLFAAFLEDKECKLAAAGGIYLDPNKPKGGQAVPPGWETDIHFAGKIEPNLMNPYCCHYPTGTKPRSVEHLYSSFMYRSDAANAIGGYCRRLSQIGHREESDFSYRFHLAGWKILLCPEAVGWHFFAKGGGIRSGDIVDKQQLSESDERIYQKRLKRWRMRAEERKRKDSGQNQVLREPKFTDGEPVEAALRRLERRSLNKMVAVISVTSVEAAKRAVPQYASSCDEIYLSAENDANKGELSSIPGVKMVACGPSEQALLTKALLSEGDHEFLMTVLDTMRFLGEPKAILSDSYDDYVFEAYATYAPVKPVSGAQGCFVADDSFVGDVVGPEVQNLCLITRRRANAKPLQERILYSDTIVLDDTRTFPSMGKSLSGNDLLPMADMDMMHWRKICTYQFPDGKLAEPYYADMEPSQKLVSIVIPTPGRLQLLKKCISSIYSNTSTPFEIVVVDNGSKDGTAEWLESEAKVRKDLRVFHQPENLGFQKAINIGVSKARGKYLLLFNDDAWVTAREPDGRDWLRVYVDELARDPKLGIVGPHGDNSSPTLKSPMLFFWCVMIPRKVWDEVGPLDEVTFKNYGGDDDYCERLGSQATG